MLLHKPVTVCSKQMAFFAPLLFLWGKRGTHLKEEKKTQVLASAATASTCIGYKQAGAANMGGGCKERARGEVTTGGEISFFPPVPLQ